MIPLESDYQVQCPGAETRREFFLLSDAEIKVHVNESAKLSGRGSHIGHIRIKKHHVTRVRHMLDSIDGNLHGACCNEPQIIIGMRLALRPIAVVRLFQIRAHAKCDILESSSIILIFIVPACIYSNSFLSTL